MGSHPKYEGNLTTFIHDESERQDIMRIVGRGMVFFVIGVNPYIFLRPTNFD